MRLFMSFTKKYYFGIFTSLFIFSSTSFAQNQLDLTKAYGKNLTELLNDNQTPRTENLQKTCDIVKNKGFPPDDYPTQAQLNSVKPYDSVQSYYGINRSIDYVRARYIAFAELDRTDTLPFNGIGMLMMIYANGFGVTRDLDLATHLACHTDGSFMEIEGRIDHLQKMKTQKNPGVFDFCDDATSGFLQGFCADKENQIQRSKQKKSLLNITKNWSTPDKKSFADLDKIASHYFVDSSNLEVDLTGTAAFGMSSDKREKLQTQFYHWIMQFEKSQFPNYSSTDFKKADQLLNSIYKKIMSSQNPTIVGTINLTGIQRTQRSWIRYKDAWLAFASKHYPKLAEDSLKTALTLERIDALKFFLPNDKK